MVWTADGLGVSCKRENQILEKVVTDVWKGNHIAYQLHSKVR